MTNTFNYEEDILNLLMNTTTRYSPFHKKYIVSKLISIKQDTYKFLSDGFLEFVLLLNTARERKIFRKSIKLLDFCNKHYIIYLCKQILGEYKPDYGFKAYANFFLNSKKFFKASKDYNNHDTDPLDILANGQQIYIK
jgi:hypothetical protein